MQVHVLFFEGCPNHQPTVQLVQEVIRDLGLDIEVEEVEVKSVKDAQQLHFLGSPTVFVDGVDIEPSARSSTAYAFACRTYAGAGTPPRALLIEALASAGGMTTPQTSSLSAITEPEKSPGRAGLWLGAAGLENVSAKRRIRAADAWEMSPKRYSRPLRSKSRAFFDSAGDIE